MFVQAAFPGRGTLLVQILESLQGGELLRTSGCGRQALLRMGITFNVYGDKSGAERIFPFDVIPRIVEAAEWKPIDRDSGSASMR